MKVSELIDELEKAKEKHGDIHVFLVEYGMGGKAYLTCGGIQEYSKDIYPGDTLDNDLSEEVIKDLFPEWNGDIKTLEDLNATATGILVSTGELIFTT